MTISDIQLYQLLKSKLGESEAEQLVSFVKDEVESQLLNRQSILATKGDLDKEISHLREDMINIMDIPEILTPIPVMLTPCMVLAQ